LKCDYRSEEKTKLLLDAFALALASSERPSSTKARSITGSSRNDGSIVKSGIVADRIPAVNDVLAPKAMSEFILGAPLQQKNKSNVMKSYLNKQDHIEDILKLKDIYPT
jgi:hypothetical protein